MPNAFQLYRAHRHSMSSPAHRWGNPNNPLFGDVHFYNYAADCLNPATYPRARFVSEFGYMSWPSWEDYRRVTVEEDWAVEAKMTAYRCGGRFLSFDRGIGSLLSGALARCLSRCFVVSGSAG